VCEHPAASPTEGERFAVVLHNEPLKAPPLDTVLERNVKILCFPPPAKLQTCAANKLVLSPSHPRPTMIKIFPETEMGEYPEKGLTQMYENGNLHNGIRVQKRQVHLVEIKETAEKGRDRKSKSTNEKRNINDRFMGILRRNGDTAANPPRVELFWKQNPNFNEMKEVGFINDRHMVTSEWKLAVGVDGRNDCSNGAMPLLLWRHRDLSGGASRIKISGKQRSGSKGKSEVRAQKSKKHVDASINGVFWVEHYF
jgi:hypothetical protein